MFSDGGKDSSPRITDTSGSESGEGSAKGEASGCCPWACAEQDRVEGISFRAKACHDSCLVECLVEFEN